jgi:hypothetical protein
VQFRVSVSGNAVDYFKTSGLETTFCEEIEVEASTPDGYEISNNSFESLPLDFQFTFQGSFPAPQHAEGTLRVSNGICQTGTRSWTASTPTPLPPPPPPVDKIAPAFTISLRKTQAILHRRWINVLVTCPAEECDVAVDGFGWINRRKGIYFEIRKVKRHLPAGVPTTIRLKVTKALQRVIRRLHRGGRHKIKVTLGVEASDMAENPNSDLKLRAVWLR